MDNIKTREQVFDELERLTTEYEEQVKRAQRKYGQTSDQDALAASLDLAYDNFMEKSVALIKYAKDTLGISAYSTQ